MKILLLINNCSYGGAEKNLVWLANQLVSNNTKVSIFVYENYTDHYFVCSSIKLITSNKKNRIRYIRRFLQGLEIFRLLNTENYDTVISFLNFPNYFACFFKLLFNYKLVISERGDPLRVMGVEKLIRNLLFRNANYLVLQSAYASNCFPAAMRSKVVIIKNFVAKSNYNLPISDSKIIGCIGRLIIAEKRQDVVLRSFKEFCRSNTDYILVFYGDGPDLRTLNNLIMEMNLTDRVKIFGYSNDLNAVYAQLKVLISASDTEGLPNVILESMASGVPVIATDYSPGGINDIITNGIDGYVVEKEDFMAISEHLTTIVNDSFLYHEMSKSARLASLKYNEFDIAQKWKDLIF